MTRTFLVAVNLDDSDQSDPAFIAEEIQTALADTLGLEVTVRPWSSPGQATQDTTTPTYPQL